MDQTKNQQDLKLKKLKEKKALNELENNVQSDRDSIIDKSLLYKEYQNEFLKKQGLLQSEKLGDLIVTDCGSANYIKYIEKYFQNRRAPNKAQPFVAEMKQVLKGIHHNTKIIDKV